MNELATMFSSKTPEWETPQFLFQGLDAEFGFELDVCATPDKAKCKRFFSPFEDGLKQDWGGAVCWMNPPYGRAIGLWMEKAFESAKRGATVVCLVPARTDTDWWHRYAQRGEVRFLRGRLKFGNAINSAPFPSAIVIFKPWCLK
jgi:phage N-6-adenine-methyltransferase